ncbi:hypothetical protein CCR95_06465 [Thiocystis minor]|nr:hypothetical protein [Thiocystis minor]
MRILSYQLTRKGRIEFACTFAPRRANRGNTSMHHVTLFFRMESDRHFKQRFFPADHFIVEC